MKIKVLLLLTFLVLLIGCEKTKLKEEKIEKVDQIKIESTEDDWKIAILTASVVQGVEEYRAAQMVIEKYGADHVITMTYPDNFMDEIETTIDTVLTLSRQENVKALIVSQAVPGVAEAIKEVRELNKDILIITSLPSENFKCLSKNSDIIFEFDYLKMGNNIIAQAKKQGAKTFVHYSFKRHMEYPFIAKRRDVLKEECKKNNILFVDKTSVDPAGAAGILGVEKFIAKDVPKLIAKYGKDTAFFSTNGGTQEPLIKAVFEGGGIYPQPCCPSPYHGFPSALNINIPEDKISDTKYLIDQIREKVQEKGMEGRMSTWPVPSGMMFIEVGADYAYKWIHGDIKERLDKEALVNCFKDYIKNCCHEEIGININVLEENGEVYKNYLLILLDYIDF